MRRIDFYICIFSLLLSGLFYSCADRDFDLSHSVEYEKGVTFRLGIPAPERVSVGTRSVSESGVKSLDVLVFYNTDGNGVMAQAPYHVDDWKEESGLITFTMAISREFPDPSGLTYLILANASDDLIGRAKVGETSVEDYKTILLNIEEAAGDHLLMTGVCTHGDLFDAHDHFHVVTMKRSVAAVSVTMAGDTSGGEFKLFGMPSQLELAAGINDESHIPVSENNGYTDAVSYLDQDTGVRYVCPVLNDSKDDPENLGMNPTAVVKAKFDGSDYYYRLSFVNKKADGTTEALDVLPNHKYEFVIKGITGPGYATEEEAANGLHSTSVEYIINDTQATIFNMVSDGVRELGISNKIEDMLGDDLTVEFYVKCYPAPSSYNVLHLSSDQDWITISSAPVDSQVITEPDGQIAKLFTYEATLAINREGTLREGNITVAWENLSATLKVQQDRSFIADRHTEVEFMVSTGSIYHSIFDYWTFINGDGTDEDYGPYSYNGVNAPYLHGIKPEDNGGRIRNQGLHFPCGEAYYSYSIRPVFSDDIDVRYYTISLRPGSKFEGKLYLDESMQPIEYPLTISYDSYADYSNRYESFYETDCLIITGYDEDGKKLSSLVMDLYHTGFFDWSDYSNNRSDRTYDRKIELGWFYYEVVPITLNGETTYWLDRNLGATASGFDVLDHDGQSLFGGDEQFPFLSGNGKSRGGMYHSVMDPGDIYSSPQPPYNFGPFGFAIPSMADFNELRNSRSFITTKATTSNLVNYYNSYYQLSNGRRVYFPKVGHMQDGIMASDASTGHYWTSTEATGVEKDELGKWLTTFVIGSGAESFSRARLLSPLYAMPVRLRNSSYKSEDYYQTFLKVQGATHVFLYRDLTDAEGMTTREWVTPWPGTSVATPEIAFDKLHNFVYETTRNVKFKVLFNFVESSGKIVTMAASDGEKGASAVGWDAEGSFVFDRSHQRVE